MQLPQEFTTLAGVAPPHLWGAFPADVPPLPPHLSGQSHSTPGFLQRAPTPQRQPSVYVRTHMLSSHSYPKCQLHIFTESSLFRRFKPLTSNISTSDFLESIPPFLKPIPSSRPQSIPFI